MPTRQRTAFRAYTRQMQQLDRRHAHEVRWAVASLIALLVGVVSLFIDVGFAWTFGEELVIRGVQVAVMLVFAIEQVILRRGAESLRTYWRAHSLGAVAAVGVLVALVLAVVAAIVVEVNWPSVMAWVARCGVLVFAVARVGRLIHALNRLRISPSMLFLMSFVVLIGLGTAGLLMPQATPADKPIGALDAAFTATSAACVTGLVVRDTATEFTEVGHLIILVLIQLGGLSILTFAGFFTVAFGSGLGAADRASFAQMLNTDTRQRVSDLIRFIFVSTFAIELVGGIALYAWLPAPSAEGWASGEQHAFYAAFHAVSAFCNAGFSLYSGSFMPTDAGGAMTAGIKGVESGLTISFLIILGGLGFAVLNDLRRYNLLGLPRLRGRFERLARAARRERFEQLRDPDAQPNTPRDNADGTKPPLKVRISHWLATRPRPELSLQTKLVLTMTVALLIVSTVGYSLLELPHADATHAGTLATDSSGRPLDDGERWLHAWFQSVNARTAGFNSVDIGQCRPATLFFLMLMMFIGGSPGSCAGGIKTIAAALVIGSAIAMWRRRGRIEVARRHVPLEIEKKALLIVVISFIVVGATMFALFISEPDKPGLSLMFEAVSAFATVGLTTGITPELSDAGKLSIMVAMFIGRVGPLTMVVALGTHRGLRFHYPREELMIG